MITTTNQEKVTFLCLHELTDAFCSRTYLTGFGLCFIQRLDQLGVIQHVARGHGQLSQQTVSQVLQQLLIVAGLLDQTLMLLLQLLLLKAHDDTQQLVLQTLQGDCRNVTQTKHLVHVAQILQIQMDGCPSEVSYRYSL